MKYAIFPYTDSLSYIIETMPSYRPDVTINSVIISRSLYAKCFIPKEINVYHRFEDSIPENDGYIFFPADNYSIIRSKIIFALCNGKHVICAATIPDEDKMTRDDIVIEMRDPSQVLNYRGIQSTLPQVKTIYPSFDVVPPHLISGAVTDKGVYVPYMLNDYFTSDTKAFY